MATDDSTNSLRLNSVDRHGRHIDPAARAAAEAVFQRALELAINLGIDYAVVANMLEEVAAEASLQLTWRAGVCEAASIRNLAGYVFRAFVRDLNRLKRKEIALVDEDTLRYTLAQRWFDPSRQTGNEGSVGRVLGPIRLRSERNLLAMDGRVPLGRNRKGSRNLGTCSGAKILECGTTH